MGRKIGEISVEVIDLLRREKEEEKKGHSSAMSLSLRMPRIPPASMESHLVAKYVSTFQRVLS